MDTNIISYWRQRAKEVNECGHLMFPGAAMLLAEIDRLRTMVNENEPKVCVTYYPEEVDDLRYKMAELRESNQDLKKWRDAQKTLLNRAGEREWELLGHNEMAQKEIVALRKQVSMKDRAFNEVEQLRQKLRARGVEIERREVTIHELREKIGLLEARVYTEVSFREGLEQGYMQRVDQLENEKTDLQRKIAKLRECLKETE